MTFHISINVMLNSKSVSYKNKWIINQNICVIQTKQVDSMLERLCESNVVNPISYRLPAASQVWKTLNKLNKLVAKTKNFNSITGSFICLGKQTFSINEVTNSQTPLSNCNFPSRVTASSTLHCHEYVNMTKARFRFSKASRFTTKIIVDTS